MLRRRIIASAISPLTHDYERIVFDHKRKRPPEGGRPMGLNQSRFRTRNGNSSGVGPASPSCEAEAQHRPGRGLGTPPRSIVLFAAPLMPFDLITNSSVTKRRGDADRSEVRVGPEVNIFELASRRAKTVELPRTLSVTDQPAVKKFTVRPLRSLHKATKRRYVRQPKHNMLSVSNVPSAVALMELLSSDAAVRFNAAQAARCYRPRRDRKKSQALASDLRPVADWACVYRRPLEMVDACAVAATPTAAAATADKSINFRMV